MVYETIQLPKSLSPATVEAVRALLVAAGHGVHRSDYGYTLELFKLEPACPTCNGVGRVYYSLGSGVSNIKDCLDCSHG